MSRRNHAFALSFLVVLWLCHHPAAGGELSTPLQTQSIPMTQTDWGPGTDGLKDPMTFQQFNPGLGTLDAIDITLTATIQNNFELIFVATPIPTTLYVATTQTTNPSVLANPSLVQQLTDGPTVTLKAPDGTTSLFGAPGTTLPVDVVTMTESSGTWSSMLPVTDPHYIAPSNATLSLSRSLDSSDAPSSLLSQFVGTGTIGMPFTAVAHSSFYSDTANGGGMVLTSADATVTVQYWYSPPAPASIPEPSSVILLGLGSGLAAVAAVRHRRATRRARGEHA